MEADGFYTKIFCKVLIMRATKALLSQDDILLPEEVVERMTKKIPNPRCVNVDGTNHYGTIFQPHEFRDRAIQGSLED